MRFHLYGEGFRKCLFLVTLSALLVSCAGAASIFIQPIQVCNDAGAGCANANKTLFEAEGDKIWAQAGIDLSFYAWNTFNAASYLTIGDDNELFNLWDIAGHGQNPDNRVISMWFVNALNLGAGTTYGVAYMPGNRIAISDVVFSTSLSYPNGRVDTIAHEIGHSLGLDHYTAPAWPGEYLMAAGSTRTVPSSIADIFPDGAYLDRLTTNQINIVLGSPLLHDTPVPEPASMALAGAGLLGLLLIRRKR